MLQRYKTRLGQKVEGVKNPAMLANGRFEHAAFCRPAGVHRYIIQRRLERASTWWTADNLDNMLAVRALRANREWDAYWTRVNQQAA